MKRSRLEDSFGNVIYGLLIAEQRNNIRLAALAIFLGVLLAGVVAVLS